MDRSEDGPRGAWVLLSPASLCSSAVCPHTGHRTPPGRPSLSQTPHGCKRSHVQRPWIKGTLTAESNRNHSGCVYQPPRLWPGAGSVPFSATVGHLSACPSQWARFPREGRGSSTPQRPQGRREQACQEAATTSGGMRGRGTRDHPLRTASRCEHSGEKCERGRSRREGLLLQPPARGAGAWDCKGACPVRGAGWPASELGAAPWGPPRAESRTQGETSKRHAGGHMGHLPSWAPRSPGRPAYSE